MRREAMDRLIALLKEKNHYLEKFFVVNENELMNFADGNFDSVEDFYQTREKILELIRYIDERVERQNSTAVGTVTLDIKVEVETCLRIKDEWVTSILQQDLRVIGYIEAEKSNIIRELKSSSQAKRAVGAYANTERISHLDRMEHIDTGTISPVAAIPPMREFDEKP
jgi:hypothetical protein